MDTDPLVGIGVPTYNRRQTLARALESALAQTHRNLLVLVYDNASSDGTEALCRSMSERDTRLRYVRHPRNLGPTANFNALFETCPGDYVMMLADDDWLEPGYVAGCLSKLRCDPGLALVAGRARYVRDGSFVHDGVLHRHLQAAPAARIVAYLRSVEDNGVFYGLMPAEVLEQVRPMPNVLGNDWLHVARIAACGGLDTLPEPRINRELGGTSADVSTILETFRGARWQARIPQLVIAWQLLRDIGAGRAVYARLGRRPRMQLALRGALASIRWPDLAWHLVTPPLASIGGRRRGRRLWSAYLRFTGALGAGRKP